MRRASGSALLLAPATARAATPMQYLATAGPRADPVTALTWGLMVVSIVVVLLMSGLVLAGVWVRRARGSDGSPARVPLLRGGGGMGWFAWGVGLTVITLAVSVVWTVIVLAQVNGPSRPAPLTIAVDGVQWWWRARYLDRDRLAFETANELHIPVGVPVRVRLGAEDVIHSFWPPALTGKTDAIPGRVNETWLQADRPGRYMGQCTEYCGLQHARMAFFIQADPPAQFETWRRAQAQPAAAPADARAAQGEAVFRARCASCHTVRGVAERGRKGPDLTHVASRPTLAAGALPNTVASLSGWIADPQAIKPGSQMPNLYLSGPELQAVTAYLTSLK